MTRWEAASDSLEPPDWLSMERMKAMAQEMVKPPTLPIQQLAIACGPRQSEESVREAILANGSDLLSLDLAAARRRIEQMPWTRSVTLQRVYPDTLEVRVLEREPVAVIREPFMAYLDSEGGLVADAPVGALAEYPAVQVAPGATASPAARSEALADAARLLARLEEEGILVHTGISEVLVEARSLRVMTLSGPALRLPRDGYEETLRRIRPLWLAQRMESRIAEGLDEIRISADGRLTLASAGRAAVAVETK